MAKVRYFYIGSTPIDIEISPQLASTLDESLDNLNVKTIANNIEHPYLPFQRFYIKDEYYNTIQTFIISADNVELATQNPNRYIHNLSLVQLSEFLTKKEIRNTVFENAQDNIVTKYVSGIVYAEKMKDVTIGILEEDLQYQADSFAYLNNPVTTTIDLSKKKIRELNIDISFFMQKITSHTGGTGAHQIYMDYEKPTKWSDIYANSSGTVTYLPSLIFTIGAETETLTISDSDYSNGDTIKVPQSIITWINSHATGNLVISIENLSGEPTFMSSQLFEDVSGINNPWMVSITYLLKLSLNDVYYNIYSVLDVLLKQQMKETDDYNSVNDSDHIKPLFLLPTLSHNPDLYNLLKETNTPNLIFTQSNMYDALAEIFKLFDAIFTIDNSGYLDIEYFNEQAQTPIDEPEVAGKSQSLSEERFTNRLITYFQNTKINHQFPNSNNENATAYLRSKTMGVPNENDYVFITPKPIDIVLEVKIKAPLTFASNLNITYSSAVHYLHFGNPASDELLDISPFVLEEEVWSILPNIDANSITDWSGNYKTNTLAYKRGTNYISVSEYRTTTLAEKKSVLGYVIKSAINCLFGFGGSTPTINIINTDAPDWRDVKLAVSYISLVDGKLVNESLDNKYEGETLINQSNGSIDINKLGLNMVGLGLKLGQPTLNMTQVFSKWDDRVRKGQYFVDDNGDRWVANNCVYTIIKPDLVQTNIEFVKNFNGLAQRIELNSEKRLSNISNELTVKCEETYGEYIYYSSVPFSADSKEKTAFLPTFIANQILMTVGSYYDSTDKVEYALITAYNKEGNIIDHGTDNGKVQNVTIPMMVYGSGNSVSFEMSYDSPISAGNQLLDNYTSNLWTGGWFSKAVLYCDTDGTADSFDIRFVKMDEELTRYYPEMKSSPTSLLSTTQYGKLSKFKYYKKPNEVFALNYQLHFMPQNKMRDFISNEFIKNNGFANGLNKRKFKIVTSTNENIYSILDTKGEGSTKEITSITSSLVYTDQKMALEITINTAVADWYAVNSWALVDDNNNIYFATNNKPSAASDNAGEYKIFFITRHHRLA